MILKFPIIMITYMIPNYNKSFCQPLHSAEPGLFFPGRVIMSKPQTYSLLTVLLTLHSSSPTFPLC